MMKHSSISYNANSNTNSHTEVETRVKLFKAAAYLLNADAHYLNEKYHFGFVRPGVNDENMLNEDYNLEDCNTTMFLFLGLAAKQPEGSWDQKVALLK